MNKHEFKQIKKEFKEMISRGARPVFGYEVNHPGCDYIIFEICLYDNFIFLGFDTDIVYNIHPSNDANILETGVKYNLEDLDGDTLDKVIEFLHKEVMQFLLDSHLLALHSKS